MIGSFETLTQKAGKRTLILNNIQYVTIDLPQLVWFYDKQHAILMFVGFKNEVDLNKIPDDAKIHSFDLLNRQYTRINDCGLFGVCISQATYDSLKDINSMVNYFFESSFEGCSKDKFIRQWKNPIDMRLTYGMHIHTKQ